MKINYFSIVDKYVPTADTQNRMCWVKWPLVYQMKLIVFHMEITREPSPTTFILLHRIAASPSSSWNLIKIKNSFQFLSPTQWADWSEWHAYDGTFIAYTIAHWLICYWTNIIKSTSQLIETDSKSIDLSFALDVMKRIFFVCVFVGHFINRWVIDSSGLSIRAGVNAINCIFDYRQPNHRFTNR